MSKEQEKHKEKAEECLHIRLTPEEKRSLWNEAEKRGIHLSAYVKQKLFLEENTKLYNTEVCQCIDKITNILIYQIGTYCSDKNFVYECERSAMELWHCLR